MRAYFQIEADIDGFDAIEEIRGRVASALSGAGRIGLTLRLVPMDTALPHIVREGVTIRCECGSWMKARWGDRERTADVAAFVESHRPHLPCCTDHAESDCPYCLEWQINDPRKGSMAVPRPARVAASVMP